MQRKDWWWSLLLKVQDAKGLNIRFSYFALEEFSSISPNKIFCIFKSIFPFFFFKKILMESLISSWSNKRKILQNYSYYCAWIIRKKKKKFHSENFFSICFDNSTGLFNSRQNGEKSWLHCKSINILPRCPIIEFCPSLL